MSDEWFYAEDGETVGPVSAETLARRIDMAPDEAHFVWAPGMPDWVDGRGLPQFSPRTRPAAAPRAEAAHPARRERETARADGEPAPAPMPKKLLQRARRELVSYLAVSTYLMVWLIAVLYYKSTILRSVGVEFAPLGVAVVKALILGKFILGLEAVRLGERQGKQAILIVQIAIRALIFTVALVVMNIIEELVVGHFHGRSLAETLGEVADGSRPQLFASALLLYLVLLPYLAFRRIAQDIGELPELLFTRRSVERQS
jgi:hypothetical protein